MRKPFIFLFLLFYSLSAGVYAGIPQGILKGRVFDSRTKEGLGGIRVLVSGENGKEMATTDDFGYFVLKLMPGRYVAQLEQIDQKIGFVVLPGKTALLDIPLKATAKPEDTPIAYSVKYSEEQSAPSPSANADAPTPQKRVQPFVQGDASGGDVPPPVAVEPQANEAPPPSGGNETYPMKGIVPTRHHVPKPLGKEAATLAIVQFKDTTDRGLGLTVAQDMAQYLFDQGVVKVVGPDSISAAIGGQPADPLNEAFGQWVSKRLGASVVVLGHLKKADIRHHQYLFLVAEKAVMTATVVLMDSKTGNILGKFTETGQSGMTGTSISKDRYFEDETIANLFDKASRDLALKLSDRLLEFIGSKKPSRF